MELIPNHSFVKTVIAFSRNLRTSTIFITLVLDAIFPVLALTVSHRHWILEESIGAMDIENDAFKTLWITLSIGTVSLVFGSILSCIMFKWINGSLHPYIEIIADQIKEEKTVKNVQKVVLVSISPLNTE